jgi:hypothetical protein
MSHLTDRLHRPRTNPGRLLAATLLLLIGGEATIRIAERCLDHLDRDDAEGRITLLVEGDARRGDGAGWSQQVADTVSDRTGRPVRLVDRTVPGMTSAVVVARVDADLHRYRPDVTVVVVDEADDAGIPAERGLLLAGADRALLHSRVYAAIRAAALRWGAGGLLGDAPTALEDDLRDLVATVDRSDSALVLAAYPDVSPAALDVVARDTGADHADLRPLFAARFAAPTDAFVDDACCTAPGFHLLADVLADHVERVLVSRQARN